MTDTQLENIAQQLVLTAEDGADLRAALASIVERIADILDDNPADLSKELAAILAYRKAFKLEMLAEVAKRVDNESLN